MAAVARDEVYRVAPAGNVRFAQLVPALESTPELRAGLRHDLDRMVRESPWNAQAHFLRAELDLMENHPAAAKDELRQALFIAPHNLDVRRKLAELGGP